MAFNKLSGHLEDLGNNLEAYLNSTVEYYKLDFFKKFMKGFSLLTKLLIVGSIFMFFLGFISVGFSLWIGSAIGSLSGGFFIIGGVYFIIFIILFFIWKKLIESTFLKKFSQFVFNENSQEKVLNDVPDELLEDEIGI